MLNKIRKSKISRVIAVFTCLSLFTEMLIPLKSYALTSGPSQPEVQSFEPIATTDMVDVFSGDFNYNIPLMQVGNYPINMFYHAGVGMDQEASWTGLGWNINPGVINRNMRGIPDDFNGDEIIRTQNIKPNETIGVSMGGNVELYGVGFSPGFRFYYNNYKGLGYGMSSGLSLGPLSMNFGYDNQEGVDASLSLTMESTTKKGERSTSMRAGASLGYNSRQGLKGLTISASVSSSQTEKIYNDKGKHIGNKNKGSSSFGSSSFISFTAPSYTPFTTPDMASFVGSMRFNIGGEGYGVYGSGYISADFQSHRLLKHENKYSTMGFLYEREHDDDKRVIMDLSRDKEVELNKYTKFMHTTNHAYDIYSVSGQGISGMYRPFRNNVGMLYDPETDGVDLSSLSFNTGLEIGLGGLFKIGGDINVGFSVSHMGPWRDNFSPYNNLQFDELSSSTNPLHEAVYFKTVGEQTLSDQDYYDDMMDTKALRIDISSSFNTEGLNRFETGTGQSPDDYLPITAPIKKAERDKRNQSITYLTATEASSVGVSNTLDYYQFNSEGDVIYSGGNSRVSDYRKGHHISEIIVTNADGTRYVYGIAAYNTSQEEYTFSVSHPANEPVKGLVKYDGSDMTTGNTKGRENYFYKEEIPPYAYAYLLTAILSPDYVDAEDDGITDDDLGTYTKINYLKAYEDYKWRTPFEEDSASYNRGLRSDAQDDKANIVYGTKEIWYVHSVETKTHIAEFSLSERHDAYGAQDVNGGLDIDQPLFRLDSISLYSRPDRITNTDNAIPIKKVHLEYDYSLCEGIPNNDGNNSGGDNPGGKLTLKELSFSYGNNTSGRLSPYVFEYDSENPDYNIKGSDRWGTYKPNNGSLLNADFPYTPQDNRTTKADIYASSWNLKEIVLPSGGVISVDYEADDYAYVQDKPATFMYKIKGFSNSPTGVSTNNTLFQGEDHNLYVQFELPSSETDIGELFNGLGKVYFNCMVNLSPGGDPENVTGYAEIEPGEYSLINSTTGSVKLKDVSIGTAGSNRGVSPIAKTAWQFTRVYRPQIAYPGSENISSTEPEAALDAMTGFVSQVRQLFEGFNQFMEAEEYCQDVTLSQSWIRLNAQDKTKLGGGHRVKEIRFYDSWDFATMATREQPMTYGQEYIYKTDAGYTSGVAAYEPMIGGDENACRFPLHNYTKEQILAPDDDHYVEGPVGESFYPGASVGYERVVVRNITPPNIPTSKTITRHATGYTVHEFYTAREFPVRFQNTNIDVEINKPSPILTFFNFYYEEYATATQGYTIELNDMHGKQKGQSVYQESGQTAEGESALVSSVKYYYHVADENAVTKDLKNEDLSVMDKNGEIFNDATIGKEIEMVVDTKEKSDFNVMTGVQVNADGFLVSVVPIIIPTPWPSVSINQRRIRFATTTKIVNRFGILEKTEALQNGATIATYNKIFDAETGDVLLTQTKNEYKDDIYNFNYPAYWTQDNMGPAYKNIGANGEVTIEDGVCSSTSNTLFNIFVPGDEVLLKPSGNPLNPGVKAWVLDKELISSDYKISFIDKDGEKIAEGDSLTYSFKIIRSGRRNQQSLSAGTLVSKNYPVQDDTISVTAATKILNSSATFYSDEWQMMADKGVAEEVVYECDSSGYNSLLDFLNYLAGQETPFEDFDTLDIPPYTFIVPPTNSPYDTCSILYGSYVNENTLTITFIPGCSFCQKGFIIYLPDEGIEDIEDIVFTSVEILTSYDYPAPLGKWYLLKFTFNIGAEEYEAYGWLYNYKPNNTPCVSMSITPTCEAVDTIPTECGLRETEYVNPYLTGLRGIWRPKIGYAYNSTRSYSGINNDFDAQQDGTYSDFTAFWRRNSGYDWLLPDNLGNPDPSLNKWVWTSEVTKYHPAGFEVENRDALGRYSAALFHYWYTQPSAVASNAQYREIAFDGFEDYRFQEGYGPGTCHFLDHWSFMDAINPEDDLNVFVSHTGKRSLEIEADGHPDGNSFSVRRPVLDSVPVLGNHDGFLEQYEIKGIDKLGIFTPDTLKNYVISLWANKYDTAAAQTYENIKVKIHFLDDDVPTPTVLYTFDFDLDSDQPVIEGWKRFEQVFEVPDNVHFIEVQLLNENTTNAVYIDDIRIHPFNSNMKTFVYDPVSLRLMAQLDENNYATFYEYDDQGTLVRVKKETERGIFTLQENRQNLNKH